MKHHFDPYLRHYESLSVADLLEAREAYHVHLMHLDSVFATAIGQFRIRREDADWNHPKTKQVAEERGLRPARTFANSVIRPWSWPCVLVFVQSWISSEELQKHPERYRDQLVPPFLYLPDGRVIPTCVLEASLFSGPSDEFVGVDPTVPVLASGQPLLTTVQKQEHVGTVTCIAFDGQRYYAMTNQHVAGTPGTEVRAWIGDEDVPIGRTADKSIGRRKFEDVYPGLPGRFTLANLDVGLVELDDLGMWTSNMHGVGPEGGTVKLGPLVEFRSDTATLDWIQTRVIGYGAASGQMRGEIKALFYRYRNIGGTDYTTDFLVGALDADEKRAEEKGPDGDFRTHPGDSGALWCIDPSQLTDAKKERHGRSDTEKAREREQAEVLYRPFAVQWGGQRLTGGLSADCTLFGLAASLAVACRELDVEVVTDWNTEHPEYWGAVGHYKIAAGAVALVSGPLHNFMNRHLDLLTFRNISAKPKTGDPERDFIPLADVPDLVWKTNINKKNKQPGKGSRREENPNHYADLDLLDDHKQTMIDVCGLDAQRWLDFYKAAPVPKNAYEIAKQRAKKMNDPVPKDHGIDDGHKGLLPFRVCQIFHDMVQFSGQGKAKEFLCAAGILAHYVGDACQPLHGSRHADGLDGDATGVHSTYEELMVDQFAKQLAELIQEEIPKQPKPDKIPSGPDAAKQLVALMEKVRVVLPPEVICKVFSDYRKRNGLQPRGGQVRGATTTLWDAFRKQTAECIALGMNWLAAFWQSAFELGNPQPSQFDSTFDGQKDLMPLYMDSNFLPSYQLKNWIPLFWNTGPCGGSGSNVSAHSGRVIATPSGTTGRTRRASKHKRPKTRTSKRRN